MLLATSTYIQYTPWFTDDIVEISHRLYVGDAYKWKNVNSVWSSLTRSFSPVFLLCCSSVSPLIFTDRHNSNLHTLLSYLEHASSTQLGLSRWMGNVNPVPHPLLFSDATTLSWQYASSEQFLPRTPRSICVIFSGASHYDKTKCTYMHLEICAAALHQVLPAKRVWALTHIRAKDLCVTVCDTALHSWKMGQVMCFLCAVIGF